MRITPTLSRFYTLIFAMMLPVATIAAPPTTSAYITDTQSSSVADQTAQGIGTVNMITCMMAAMRPDALVNQSDYIALVDESKCNASNRDSASNSGSSNAGSTAAQYTVAVVNSSRASNNDPMIGKIWLTEEEGGQAKTIFVHMAASAAPTTANPYGTFRVDYCGKDIGGGACMFNGFLDTSNSGLSFYDQSSQGGNNETTAMTLTVNGTTSGAGKMSIAQTGGGSPVNTTFTFAYNPNYFRRDDGVTDQCFSRDATDAGTGFSVWRYGLYDASSGDRITRNSGFPIDYTYAGTTYHGYLGYYGLWLPQSAMSTIATGSTVQKVTYSNGNATATAYTLVKAGGKLTRYTKGSKTLAGIDKIRFNFWAAANTGPAGLTGYAQGTSYEAYWDNTNLQFVITGYQSCGGNGCNIVSITAVPTTNAYWSSNYTYGLSGWSQALGGEVFIDTANLLSDGSNSAAVVVNYRTQDLVYPSEYASVGTLECITDCPTANGIAALLANSASTPFGATAGNYTPSTTLVDYTLDVTTGELLDTTATAVTTASTSLSGQYQYGIRSGKLFPLTQATTVDAADGAADGHYQAMSVDSLTVYYIWETGPNGWNQFSAAKDSGGNFVAFDPPLQLSFTVPAGAAYGAYAGQSIILQYNGFGDLFGIPGKCVSPVDNSDVSCNTANARYVAEFMIPFDQVTGVVSSGSTNYLVKWLDREIRLAQKPTGDCTTAGLTLPSGITLPTSAGLNDPSNAASAVYIGTQPTVTAAPRVIHGQVQY